MFTKQQLAAWREQGFEFDGFYDSVAVDKDINMALELENAKPELKLTFISAKEEFLNYLITFSIEGKNLINKLGVLTLFDLNTNNLISTIEVEVENKGFSKQYLFPKSNLFDKSEQEIKAKLYCNGITVESKIFQIGTKNIKKCFCERDFTVIEVQKIVDEIRENSFYKVDGKDYPISNLHNKLFYRNDKPSQKYSTELVPEKDQSYLKLTKILNIYFKKYKILKCIQKIHFLAQMYTETEYFTKTIEGNEADLSYDPYRGRGFMHLTGEKNYEAFKKELNIDIAEPNYSKVSMDLDLSMHTAAWFWSIRGKAEFNNLSNRAKYKDILDKTINDLSLYEDKYIDRICRIVNGGDNAIEERKANYLTFKTIFDYENCKNKK